MSQATPTTTPVRSANHKKLPLIVDVAIDNNTGQQLYQVHESCKSVRKEMPKSTNFAPTAINEDMVYFDNTEKTPIKNILGTLSPSTLREKKYLDVDEYDEPLSNTRVKFNSGISAGISRSSSNEDVTESDNDIWSEDVEKAFEDVLNLIPKNGLTKIKIAGRSCGRNELISDYIFTKTGKLRTRKQISSHIQVIKNLGENRSLINLINDGPAYTSETEREEATKKFEEIFSSINLNKALGFNNSLKRDGETQLRPQKRRKTTHAKRYPKYKFENFFMAICDQYNLNPIVLSMQQNINEVKSLKIKANANISSRFPGLDEFRNCTSIPLIHNMVRLVLPTLPKTHTVKSGFNSGFALKRELPEVLGDRPYPKTYSIFTNVYLHGKESLKFNSDGLTFDEDHEFLSKFWKFFLENLIGKKEPDINTALKALTIKQIVYEECSHTAKQVVPKSKVMSVLLWEFASVVNFSEAVTSTTNLVLPPLQIETSSENVSSQVLDYTNPKQGTMAGPSNLNLSHSNWTATTTALESTFSNGTMSSSLQPSTAVLTADDQWDQSQSRVQKKFQQLQQATQPNLPLYPAFSPYSSRHVPLPVPQAAPVMGGPVQQGSSLPLPGIHHSTNMDLANPSGGVILTDNTRDVTNNGFHLNGHGGYHANGAH
ncbi:Transcription activator TEC1 [Spathaspora sp. JA1]|nr:Transcription activator TEC1 [Spathaspora sp. JA1]